MIFWQGMTRRKVRNMYTYFSHKRAIIKTNKKEKVQKKREETIDFRKIERHLNNLTLIKSSLLFQVFYK